MTTPDPFTPFDEDGLPPVLVRYLAAGSDPSSRSTIVDLFAASSRVVDEGIEYTGIDAIAGWLARAGSEYTYTTTLLGQRRVNADRWVVLARLDGDFPGGVADLRYRFTISDQHILDLVIAP